jgi:hypothetical protein
MIDRNHLEDFVARVMQRFDDQDAHALFMRFMCHCLILVQKFLPEVGRKALASATLFWLEDKGQAEDLVAARVSCWEYLDAKGRSTEIKDKEDAAMRAIICVLYAEPDSADFSAETLRWFAEMLDQLGDYSSETKQLMNF